ncbi:MAG: MOSC domain-containing protein [Planctomycetota bacterium]
MSLEMKELLSTMPQTGTVEWIGVRPGRKEPIEVVSAVAIGPKGLEGDRFNGPEGAPRTITLIQLEHIACVAAIMKFESIDPADLRRNIVVSGINLQALKDNEFSIGDVVLFGTGNCPPCSRMEENLGAGGYNAMRGHGGITARVVVAGEIKLGDSVALKAD